MLKERLITERKNAEEYYDDLVSVEVHNASLRKENLKLQMQVFKLTEYKDVGDELDDLKIRFEKKEKEEECLRAQNVYLNDKIEALKVKLKDYEESDIKSQFKKCELVRF